MIKQTKPHILIVDDDRQIRMMLARFLAEHEMRVTQAGDGEQMFKTLEAGRFDVIELPHADQCPAVIAARAMRCDRQSAVSGSGREPAGNIKKPEKVPLLHGKRPSVPYRSVE